MAGIAFLTCENGDTSNQELRIMFFDMWALTSWKFLFKADWRRFIHKLSLGEAKKVFS